MTADRRHILRAALGGGAASALVLPEQWVKPVVKSVIVPAHAAAEADLFQPVSLPWHRKVLSPAVRVRGGFAYKGFASSDNCHKRLLLRLRSKPSRIVAVQGPQFPAALCLLSHPLLGRSSKELR
jgi:hypothetical protein